MAMPCPITKHLSPAVVSSNLVAVPDVLWWQISLLYSLKNFLLSHWAERAPLCVISHYCVLLPPQEWKPCLRIPCCKVIFPIHQWQKQEPLKGVCRNQGSACPRNWASPPWLPNFRLGHNTDRHLQGRLDASGGQRSWSWSVCKFREEVSVLSGHLYGKASFSTVCNPLCVCFPVSTGHSIDLMSPDHPLLLWQQRQLPPTTQEARTQSWLCHWFGENHTTHRTMEHRCHGTVVQERKRKTDIFYLPL